MKYFSVFIIIISFLSSCQKKDDTTTPKGKDVYIVGSLADSVFKRWIACYWKNGKAVYLNSPDTIAQATGITVDGSDIYVSGFIKAPTSRFYQAAYWKNGVIHIAMLAESYADCIAVSEGQVYLGGKFDGRPYYSDKGIPGYRYLSEGLGRVESIAVVGGDVYAAGIVEQGTNTLPLYWINGKKYYCGDSINNGGSVSCIAVSEGNVYVTGASIGNDAICWKNGKNFQLERSPGSAFATARSVVVVGNDIYVAGHETVSFYTTGVKYWKNGKMFSVTESLPFSSPVITGIAVDGDDIYITGYIDPRKGNYWKNGKQVLLPEDPNKPLPNSVAYAVGIVIK